MENRDELIQQLGISNTTLLRELGYDPDEQAEKHVWRVTEWDAWKRVVQRRNIPAHSRLEAKAKYDSRYRKFPRTKLTAIIIGEMSEWAGDPEE